MYSAPWVIKRVIVWDFTTKIAGEWYTVGV